MPESTSLDNIAAIVSSLAAPTLERSPPQLHTFSSVRYCDIFLPKGQIHTFELLHLTMLTLAGGDGVSGLVARFSVDGGATFDDGSNYLAHGMMTSDNDDPQFGRFFVDTPFDWNPYAWLGVDNPEDRTMGASGQMTLRSIGMLGQQPTVSTWQARTLRGAGNGSMQASFIQGHWRGANGARVNCVRFMPHVQPETMNGKIIVSSI